MDCTELVFIGKNIGAQKQSIIRALNECALGNDEARMMKTE
jgi:hypothetical protein